ncbi:MAG: Aldehyde dehydrogenase AldA [Acidimicrobiales bacterium]|nr:Aldehyde dehydrogenase AldA [Acidimicrobiales bacterium]
MEVLDLDMIDGEAVPAADRDVPFGGCKASGIGREMGVAGLEEHLETQAIAEGV